jgi:hypothetical protein
VVVLQGIRPPRCGLPLALFDLPSPLPVGHEARLALLPHEDSHDADQYDPYHHDGPAENIPTPWVPMSPERAKLVRRLAQQSISLMSTHHIIIHNLIYIER